MWHLSGESMIRGHVTLPFTHLYEENSPLPQTAMAEALKAAPGSRGLCVTLPQHYLPSHFLRLKGDYNQAPHYLFYAKEEVNILS